MYGGPLHLLVRRNAGEWLNLPHEAILSHRRSYSKRLSHLFIRCWRRVVTMMKQNAWLQRLPTLHTVVPSLGVVMAGLTVCKMADVNHKTWEPFDMLRLVNESVDQEHYECGGRGEPQSGKE